MKFHVASIPLPEMKIPGINHSNPFVNLGCLKEPFYEIRL